MKILIIYESVEGQTRKIAHFLESLLADRKIEVDIVDANDPRVTLSFDGVDGLILAAPVHERRHPERFEILVRTILQDMARIPTLFLSVSLSAAFPEGREDAEDYITEFKMRTGVTPHMQAAIAGAVRSAQYDYYASQVVKHVVLRGREAKLDQSGLEATDWVDLERTAMKFLSFVSAGAGSTASVAT